MYGCAVTPDVPTVKLKVAAPVVMFTEAGQPVIVGPAGEMLQVIFTWPVNPFCGEMVAVKLPEVPTVTDWVDGVTDTEKSVTFSPLEALCVLVETLALVPWTLT